MALPTRLVTTWPIRCGSWWIRSGPSGTRQVSGTPRRAAAGSACSDGRLDRRAEVVRAEVEEHEAAVELRQLEQVLGEPVEPLDLLAARLEELGARLRVVAGLLLEQLVERAQGGDRRAQLVRDVGQEVAAPVAVAADDPTLSSSRSAMGLNGLAELGELGAAATHLADRHARGEVALGEPARRLGQAPERGREPAGQAGRDDHRQPQGEQRRWPRGGR